MHTHTHEVVDEMHTETRYLLHEIRDFVSGLPMEVPMEVEPPPAASKWITESTPRTHYLMRKVAEGRAD